MFSFFFCLHLKCKIWLADHKVILDATKQEISRRIPVPFFSEFMQCLPGSSIWHAQTDCNLKGDDKKSKFAIVITRPKQAATIKHVTNIKPSLEKVALLQETRKHEGQAQMKTQGRADTQEGTITTTEAPHWPMTSDFSKTTLHWESVIQLTL